MQETWGLPLAEVVSAHRDIINELSWFDPLRTASTFAGLLAAPGLQSNCLRLEVLVHLALGFGRGRRKPDRKHISRWFASLQNGPCGLREDPAEDVFVSLVSSPRGNFRVLQGIWESSTFFLQRVLNIVEKMPNGT